MRLARTKLGNEWSPPFTATFKVRSPETAAAPRFSPPRGWFAAPFERVVSADDPAALIACTVDGSDPKAGRTAADAPKRGKKGRKARKYDDDDDEQELSASPPKKVLELQADVLEG